MNKDVKTTESPAGADSLDRIVGLAPWQRGLVTEHNVQLWTRRRDHHPMDSAPRNGTKIMLLIQHGNYWLADDAERDNWQQWCVGKWIDHNGGGFTWHGISGTPVAWLPLPNGEDQRPLDGKEIHE
jgi:hypothetical protein